MEEKNRDMEQCVMFQEPAEDTDSEAREGSTDFRTKATEVKEILPCVPLRGVTIFPHTVVHFDIGREKSIRALERAMATDKLLFVSSQKDDRVVIPTVEDIYSLGTVVRVKQTLKIQGDAVRVLVEGICRATMDECITEENYISCTIDRIPETVTEEDLSAEDKAMLRYLAESFTEYARATSQISEDLVAKTLDTDNPADLVDSIANEIFVSTGKKQKVLEALVFSDRIRVLTELIAEENEIASLEKTVAQKVKENIDSGQRDYYLREKIKAIQSELGMDEDAAAETAERKDGPFICGKCCCAQLCGDDSGSSVAHVFGDEFRHPERRKDPGCGSLRDAEGEGADSGISGGDPADERHPRTDPLSGRTAGGRKDFHCQVHCQSDRAGIRPYVPGRCAG